MNAHTDFDDLVCKRVGSLSAHGMDDRTIADVLLLTPEDVAVIKTTEPFKQSYAIKLAERAESIIDREEGWDAVEEAALGKVLSSLQNSFNPDFALRAAALANRAVRRTPTPNKTIDASRAGNMIILSLSKTYVNNAQKSPNSAVIDSAPRDSSVEIPRRQADLPTPKRVSEMLQISEVKQARLGVLIENDDREELRELAAKHGIDTSLLED